MSTPNQTTVDQQSKDMGLLLIVKNPRYIPGNGQQEYIASVVADTIRHNITLPLEGTVTNTPHGYYIVDDDTVAGGKLLFEFFTGDDAYAALREARASLQVERDSVQVTPSPGSAAGGQSEPQSHHAPRTQDRGEKSPGTVRGLHGGIRRVPTADDVPEPHRSADLSGIQGLTLVDPMKMETSTRGEQAYGQRFITEIDRNSLIPLHSVWAAHHCKMHTVVLTLDDAHHPIGPRGWEYNLLLDTGSTKTWFYAHDFRMVSEVGAATVPWSPKDRTNTQGVGSKKVVDPPRAHGEPVFDLKKPPSHANEELVKFGDGAVIYIRHLTDHNIHAKFPRWDWKENKPATTMLKLPCVLAYAVNSAEVKFRWDGGLGLRISPDFYDAYPPERPMHYLMALESEFHVEKPYEFLIKLNHPDKVRECVQLCAPSFVYHGQDFPCENKPTFTPKIPLSFRTLGSERVYSAWSVWLKTIGFQVFQLQPAGHAGGSGSREAPWHVAESYTIDLTKPFHTDASPANDNPNQSQGTSSKVGRAPRKLRKPERPQERRGKAPQSQNPPVTSEASNHRGINIMLDTGSARTWLPASVINEIAVTWLRNDPALLASSGTVAYCGPERNLDQCEIVFTFVGHDDQPVELRCPAKPFFKAPWRLQLRGATAPISRNHYHSTLSRVVQPGTDHQTNYIFGINFYWATFVQHSSPPVDEAQMLSETPYVQFAPQKAVRKSDRRVVEAEGFPLLRSQPPRQFGS